MTKKQFTRHNQIDEIGTFWNLIGGMYDNDILIYDLDFNIVHKTTLLLKDNRILDFLPSGKKVLRLNFNFVYYLYAKEMLLMDETPMRQGSLHYYLRKSTYFLGVEQASNFYPKLYDSDLAQRIKRIKALNAICFDYNLLVQKYDINLEREYTDAP